MELKWQIKRDGNKNIIKNRNLREILDSWNFFSIVFALLILAPIGVLLTNLFSQNGETFTHIYDTLLKEYVVNSLKISISVGILTAFLGVIPAWFLAIYDFRFSKILKRMLILPLAIPTYIGGYVYSGIFSYTGVISRVGRNYFDKNILIDIMTIEGAIIIFSLFLYPYVFLITYSFFRRQSASLIEASSTLGKSDFETFILVALPLARTAIIGGVTLVIMEVLNAYGLVSYFGINTFSTGIFKTWLTLGDTNGAIALAVILMLVVIVIVLIERISRGRRRFSFSSTKIRPLRKKKLSGKKESLIILACSIPVIFGFIIPIVQLISWSFLTYKDVLNEEFLEVLKNSLFVSILGAIVIVIVAIVIANSSRLAKGVFSKLISKVTTVGYSIPGAVIAIGVMIFCLTLDRAVFKKAYFYGTIGALIFAYTIRFLAVAFNSVESGFDKVGTKFHEASRALGKGRTATFFKVDFPMIKGSAVGAVILVFLEIIKELPLTLILRPFNFQTLSTYTKQYVEDEMVHHGSIPSLTIIVVGIIIIMAFEKFDRNEGEK